MLYLHPPYFEIGGVSFLPDHADPAQFYYMPMSPRLSTFRSGDGLQIPQIQLIKFAGTSASTGDELNGGFVDFDCNLGIDPDRLAELADQLRAEAGLRDAPRLAPIPLIDGTVRMMLFGAETPEEQPGIGGPTPPSDSASEFVVKISHHAKPALDGVNQAAFSVRLDQEGVTILEQALQGELAPIGIVYSLDYIGLRPAYDVRVDADWDRVQTHIETSEKVNVPMIASIQIDEVVDELIEEQIITIESDLFVAEEDTSGAAGRRDAALSQVRKLVFENFFQPSLEPMPRETGDTIDDFGRVLRTTATSGFSFYERREVDLTRIDRKRLNINLSERTAVIDRIHPQGHLTGIARTIADQGLDLDRFVTAVSLVDPFFLRRRVRVIPRADFANDQIQSINVTLEYEGDVKNVVLDPTTGEQPVEWPSSLDGGQMRSDVTVSYETVFSTAAVGRPRTLRSKPEVVRGDVVDILPRDDVPYEIRWIAFEAADFPWDRYHTAEVQCRYVDDANGIDISNVYGLTEQVHNGAWPVFALDPDARTFQYLLRYHGVDGRDWESGWRESDDGHIRIADPFPSRRTFDVVVPSGLFGTALDRVFVDVSYEDPANDVAKRESFELSAEDSATKRFDVELLDPLRRAVSFKVSMIRADGTFVEIPESTTSQERIIVTPQMGGHRSIRITTDGGDFGAARLRDITVESRYEGDALRFADTAVLTPSSTTGSFEFDFAGNDDTYQYRVVHRFESGSTRDSGWQMTSADEIVAEVR